MKLELQRAYGLKSPKIYKRVLVDRLWPRGISKEKLGIDYWAKELAPSNELRNAYHKKLLNWEAFTIVYLKELKQHVYLARAFLREIEEEPIVHLIFASKDQKKNHAQILKLFLERIK